MYDKHTLHHSNVQRIVICRREKYIIQTSDEVKTYDDEWRQWQLENSNFMIRFLRDYEMKIQIHDVFIQDPRQSDDEWSNCVENWNSQYGGRWRREVRG